MRIFYISHSFGAWASLDHIWDKNIRETLVNMGHELLEPSYNTDLAQQECSRDKTGRAKDYYSELLIKDVHTHLRSGHIDLMFTYFDNRNVHPEAIVQIRNLGVLTVNFFCNAAHEFHKVDKVASHFDYCMVPEKVAIKKYQDVGARPIHIQMAANPNFYRPFDLPSLYDVSFIGTKYFNREEHLLKLSNASLNVHVFGVGWIPYRPSYSNIQLNQIPRRTASLLLWPIRNKFKELRGLQLPYKHYHSSITDEEMVCIFNRSKIVLGLSDVIDTSGNVMRHIRLRDFEAPMCGAFYLTGYQEELQEYYEIGKEIECYDNLEELAEKAKYFVNKSKAREKISKAGLQRAQREHTWENRFNTLFQKIGMPN